jgi:serine/threonine protein phosphatase 1
VSTVAIGDIHGNGAALRDLLGQLVEQLGPTDELVFLGDYIDRGPESRACIDDILAFRARTTATVTCLRGNHEEWLLKTMDDYSKHSWLLMDATPTIRSYSAEADEIIAAAARSVNRLLLYTEETTLPYACFFDAMPETHRAFFRSLRSFHVTADAICVHAGVDPAVPTLNDQSPRTFTWGTSGFPEKYRGDLPVIYGHLNNAVINDDGWPHPRLTTHTLGIDTIGHGVLTAVRLPDRRVFQSARFSQ